MTTILYDGKNLHADRRIVSAGLPSRVTDDGTKLFRSQCNRFAIGVGGVLPADEKILDMYFAFAFHLLVNRHNGRFTDRCALKDVGVREYKFPNVDDVGFIAISNTHAVRVEANRYHPQSGDPTFMGTGGRFAFAAHWVTHDPATAMAVAAKHDGLTSPVFDTIPATTLSPFVLG